MRLWKPLLCLIALTSCGTTTAAMDAADQTTTVAPATTITETVSPTTISEITALEANALEGADRLAPPTTLPPDPCGVEAQAYVNGLPYHVLDPTLQIMPYEELMAHYATLTQAYQAIGTCLGWTQPQLDKWHMAIVTDMSKEAVGCWNIMGGATIGGWCEIGHQGRHEDAGFGQLTRSLYGSNAVLCKNHGICSAGQIIATPWSSISWAMITIMEIGPGPWGYDTRSRNFHPILAKMPRCPSSMYGQCHTL